MSGNNFQQANSEGTLLQGCYRFLTLRELLCLVVIPTGQKLKLMLSFQKRWTCGLGLCVKDIQFFPGNLGQIKSEMLVKKKERERDSLWEAKTPLPFSDRDTKGNGHKYLRSPI